MTTVAGSPRTACTVKKRDIVQVNGEPRVVDDVLSRADGTAPYIILRFKGGHPPLRIHAGAQLEVERPQ